MSRRSTPMPLARRTENRRTCVLSQPPHTLRPNHLFVMPGKNSILLRPATPNDRALLRYRDEQPRVIASDPNDDLRAIDIWIGGAADLGKGYGTEMMRQAIARCFADPAVTAFLIPEFDMTEDSRTWIREHCDTFFEIQLNEWYTDPSLWPAERGWETFSAWFEVEFIDIAWDLVDAPLSSDPPVAERDG